MQLQPADALSLNVPENINLTLAAIGTGCWGVCFWWMHSISIRQNSLLKELSEMAQRIERLSREEHEMVKEVHPIIGEIKAAVDHVEEAVDPKTARSTSAF